MADVDGALGKQILDVPQPQGKRTDIVMSVILGEELNRLNWPLGFDR